MVAYESMEVTSTLKLEHVPGSSALFLDLGVKVNKNA